jgi:cytochrome b561
MRRYSVLMIMLHWLTALLVLGAYFTSVGGRAAQANPPMLHFTLGFAVLVLLIPRLISRFTGGAPVVKNQHRAWLDSAARLGHWMLYGLLALIPLTGWYTASRLGVPISIFGLFNLPAIASSVQGSPGWIAELHQLAGNAILILAGLHALIALGHQFLLKDGTLDRMRWSRGFPTG